MIKAETRRQRHAQLWESGAASARRVAIGGLIFAILILLRVVEPYHLIEGEREQAKSIYEEKKASLEKEEDQLVVIERTLQEIEDELEQEPWNVEKNKLIAYFQNLRRSGSGDLPVPKDKANETIDNIVKLVEGRVIKKLRAVMAAPETSERLAGYPNRVQDALDQWRNENYDNTNWYFTRESKDETIRGMSRVLTALKIEALAAVTESKAGIPDKRKEIETEKADNEKKIRKAEENIEDDLYDILPQWAENSIGVRSMVLLYPWFLLAIAANLTGKALISARHFHGMADEEQWTAVERSDPLVSSPWTLTWRGLPGTVVTIVNYGVVILVLVFCMHRAAYPPSPKVARSSIDTTVESSSHAFAESVSSVVPVDIAYALLIATLAVVVATPVLRRIQKS